MSDDIPKADLAGFPVVKKEMSGEKSPTSYVLGSFEDYVVGFDLAEWIALTVKAQQTKSISGEVDGEPFTLTISSEDKEDNTVKLLLDIYRAAQEEYTPCPYCSGRLGMGDSERHDDYCTIPKKIEALRSRRKQ